MKPFEPESCICCSLFVPHQVGGFAQSCQRGASTGLFWVHASTSEHADHRAVLCTLLPRNTSVAGDGTKVAAGQDEGGALQRRGTCVFSCRLLSKDSIPDCAGVLGQTCSLASPEASKKEAPKAETGGPPMKRPACSSERAASSSAMPGRSDTEIRPPALGADGLKVVRAKLVAKFSGRFGAAPGDPKEA